MHVTMEVRMDLFHILQTVVLIFANTWYIYFET
jgi:hypothetical protein